MNYFRDGASGNERSVGGSSSRKGKKSHSDKPKQPQRGLGVAQLEKIRLHSQLGFHPAANLHPQEDIRILTAYSPPSSFSYTSTSPTYNTSQGQQNLMMGVGELERSNMIYGQSQPSSDPRWNASNPMFEAEHFAQPGITTRHLFQIEVEDSLRKKKRSDSMGSSSQNSDSNGMSQELDLELRLSL